MTSLSDPVLSLRNLGAVFPDANGGLHALSGLTFSLEKRQFVCVLGPTGGGKSTLLRILGGLLPPTEGEVLFDGSPLTGPHPKAGFVFQQANLMPWRSVIENITLPLELRHIPTDEARLQAEQLIDLVGLKGFADWLPRDLSGGMAQRVAIARALISDPEVLLLDEPFGALDAITRERMGLELLRIWEARRKTVVMVTHDIPEAILLADRILVLSAQPGRLKLDFRVDLPRPRGDEMRYTPEFAEMTRYIRSAIG